jgi:hypothetical protein
MTFLRITLPPPVAQKDAMALRLAALLVFGCLFLSVAPAAAQSTALAVDENIRYEPQGVVVARLVAGTRVEVLDRQGPWSRVTFRGTVWEASLQRRDGGSFDHVVAAEEGENLREGPGGRVLGRLNTGTLLNERGREPGWIHVERTAWIWTASLADPETAAPQGAPATGAARAPVTPPTTARPATAAAGAANDWVRAGGRGSPLLASPDGDTLATARGGTELRVTGREGNWARVRVEGWVWLPTTEASGAEGAGSDVVLEGVSPADLTREPERYRGRLVRLELQFISLERAEAVRTDFLEGEPFLLLRSTDADRGFVYVAVPQDRMDAVEALEPLERVRILGRVRAGAAAFTGNPVLELVEFSRVR